MRKTARSKQGVALLASLASIVLLSGLTLSILSMALAQKRESHAATERQKAFYAAEAGLAEAIAALRVQARESGMPDVLPPIGSSSSPIAFGGGGYWAEGSESGEGLFTLRATGSYGSETERLEVVLATGNGGIFANAVFAGNSSGDPTYSLDLGGMRDEADYIVGDIYSGGDIGLSGDAAVLGNSRALGTINGLAGSEGITQPIPDIPAMDYPSTHDINVANLFAEARYTSDDAGGLAYQLPSTSPAHIFRKNPSDRVVNTLRTEKDDYFLEDPYETVNIDRTWDGSDPYLITLSGRRDDSNGNEKLYFIDGNLWLHNRKSFTFQFRSDDGTPVRAVFVVRGNIYFSDNLYYQDPQQDALAFIAMKDDGVEDSGNIYFGDSIYGTIYNMDAFMYAENNFYDTHLDAEGSARVTLRGNMTAGNHVKIQRDYNDHHSRLCVLYDDRLATGAVTLPGLPTPGGIGEGIVNSVSWRRVAP
jgi:hypothetical protein